MIIFIYIYICIICFTFFLDTDTCQAKSVRMILGMLIWAEKYTVCSKAIFRHTTGKCHTRRGFAMLDVAKTDRLARRRQTHANEPQGELKSHSTFSEDAKECNIFTTVVLLPSSLRCISPG